MGNLESNVVPINRRNVVGVYETPIYLHENSLYVLDLTIEQDPIKVFPFHEMCSEEVQEWIKDNHDLTIEQVIPFLLQLRGIWNLAINETLPRNSFFKNADPDRPQNAEFPIEFGSSVDKWFATRAFRVVVKLIVGDEEQWVHLLMTPGNPEITVEHVGSISGNMGYKVVPGPPGRPYEACFAVGVSVGRGGDEEVEHVEDGGGPNYDFRVEWDGWCVTTVHIEAMHTFRCAVHVEQDEIHCPGGWGPNASTEVEIWKDLWSGGRTHIATAFNDFGYTMGEQGYNGPLDVGDFFQGAIPGLGAHFAAGLMYWVTNFPTGSFYRALGLPPPRDTCWQGGFTWSVDEEDYDWTQVGTPNHKAYLSMLAVGWSTQYSHAHFDPTPLQGGKIGYVRCPALCGSTLQGLNPDDGEYTGWQPFASGIIGGFASVEPAPPGAKGYNRIEEVTRAWWDAAKNRLAEYEQVTEPPKIKITARFEVVGGDAALPATTKYFYGTLPHRYVAQAHYRSFGDIYPYVHDSMYFQVVGEFRFVVNYHGDDPPYYSESDDRFSYAEIGAGVLNCEFKLNRDGFEATWLESIDGIEGDSTIPQESFYEGPDTFIWRNGGPNYQSWLGLD